MKRISLNLWLSIVLFALYTVTAVIDMFTLKAITASSTVMALGGLILYAALFRKIKPVYYIGLLAFTFFAQYLGAMLHFYLIFGAYDMLLHFLSGALLVFAADYLFEIISRHYENHNIPTPIYLLSCFLSSVACAAIWEIWEFAGDKLLGLSSQLNSLDDTMTDIICGAAGAVIGTALIYFLIVKKRKKLSE